MPLVESSVDRRRTSRVTTYQPLLLVVAAASLGILFDYQIELNLAAYFAIFLFAISSWFVGFKYKRFRVASLLLYLAFMALAAGWHNYRWNYFGANEIGLYATVESQPVCLQATVMKEPDWVAAPSVSTMDPIPRGESTRLVLSINRLRQGNQWVNVSGQVDCWVRGQLPAIGNGATLLISGQLAKFKPPTNPGEFDFRNHNRTQRRLARLLVNHPAAVQVVEPSTFPSSIFSNLRGSLNRSIWKFVGQERAPLASAILLGNREQLDSSERQKYLVSGTVHLLAISGLHVGILATGFLFLGRLGLVPRKFCLLATIVFVLSYAWLVEFRPPVVRASILITIYCVSKWTGRSGLTFNSLGFAAIIVLLFNPTQLMSVGAQLSFLAVAVLAFFYPYFAKRPTTDPLDRLIERTRPRNYRLRKYVLEKCRIAFLVSGVVWLLALPLVAERFHIVAPVALLVNPLLVLPLTVGLFCGFGVLVFGNVFPPLAWICGTGCDGSLGLVEQLIYLSDRIPAGHFWTSGPGTVAVYLFYIGFLLLVIYPPTRLPRRWAWTALVSWLAFVVTLPGISSRQHLESNDLTCTFIDVGHGTSVLLQMPGGKTVLYDCGSFGSSYRATNSISGVLWHYGINHLDMLIISHTDLDHYNAMPDLLERFSIGQIAISPVMQGPGQNLSFLELLQRAQGLGIKISVVATGSSMHFGDSVDVQVLSPPGIGTGGSDNSNSIVLQIQLGDKSLLLPGDLDGPGLKSFLATPKRHFDVIMAPHHGSRNSHPKQVIDWCNPDVFVASGDLDDINPETIDLLSTHHIELRHTARHGAVQVTLEPKGITLRNWSMGSWAHEELIRASDNISESN